MFNGTKIMSGGRWKLALACAAGGLMLLAAAFADGRPYGERDWIPLNEAVEAAVMELDGEGRGAAPGKDEEDGKAQPEGSRRGDGSAATELQGGDAGAGDRSGAGDGRTAEGEAGTAAGSGDNEIPDAGQATASAETPSVGTGLQPGAAEGSQAGEPDAGADGRIDINRASAAELDALKGIGPAKAQAIVDDRERNGYFARVEDLLRVKGIGEKLLEGIKESVVARP